MLWEGEYYMSDSMRLWPTENMDFWRIEGNETVVSIRWSHNCFQDYKVLAYQFYECGHKTFVKEGVMGACKTSDSKICK